MEGFKEEVESEDIVDYNVVPMNDQKQLGSAEVRTLIHDVEKIALNPLVVPQPQLAGAEMGTLVQNVEKMALSPLVVSPLPGEEDVAMVSISVNPAADASLQQRPGGIGRRGNKSKKRRNKLGLNQKTETKIQWNQKKSRKNMHQLAGVIVKMKSEEQKKSAVQDLDEALPERIENDGKDLDSLVSLYEEMKREGS